jgi:primosomal protein N' (replication factor Y)
MGPIEAPLARIANRHRWQILIKSADTAGLHHFAHELIRLPSRSPAVRDIKVTVDVDPFLFMYLDRIDA